jgi:hypothetical protein
MGDVKPLPIKIVGLNSRDAYNQFMDRFYELADSLIFSSESAQ